MNEEIGQAHQDTPRTGQCIHPDTSDHATILGMQMLQPSTHFHTSNV